MTAIVFCQGVIAMDRQSTQAWGVRSEAKKYGFYKMEHEGGHQILFTGAGNGTACRVWTQEQALIQAGKIPQCIKDHTEEGKTASLLSFVGNKAYEHVYDKARDVMIQLPVEGDVLGFGLANEIAQAVALMWRPEWDLKDLPQRAVEVCCQIYSGCGVGIDVLTYDHQLRIWSQIGDPNIVPLAGMFTIDSSMRRF